MKKAADNIKIAELITLALRGVALAMGRCLSDGCCSCGTFIFE